MQASVSLASIVIDPIAYREKGRLEVIVDPVFVNGKDYPRESIWKYVVDHGTCPRGHHCHIQDINDFSPSSIAVQGMCKEAKLNEAVILK